MRPPDSITQRERRSGRRSARRAGRLRCLHYAVAVRRGHRSGTGGQRGTRPRTRPDRCRRGRHYVATRAQHADGVSQNWTFCARRIVHRHRSWHGRDRVGDPRGAKDWRVTICAYPAQSANCSPHSHPRPPVLTWPRLVVPPQRRGPPRYAAGHVAERRKERLTKSSRSHGGHTDSLRSWRSLLLSGPRVPGVMLTVTGEAEQG